ncbi:flagellar biosynthetic protein FliO [Methylobacillus arboreus]|uniref:flagellar biosynthetic protein FliO n=1 Tax=Methylobacillus arboreus TaxID=755170 RepID=UPI001E472AEB|nr:flagellar biosynthetic protein FliO [Methylobacillus arboreus]MCB5189271.1 flagellar biosynthetic protein FliO [Methylobacillus arboreus]
MMKIERLTACSVTLAGWLLVPALACAAADEVSATGSLVRMVLGLALVLGVMMAIAWLMKRMTPGLKQQSVVRIVGGVSVGSRERVVVVEVSGRWLVLGVAPGQVTSLADLEPGEEIPVAASTVDQPSVPFSAWLNKSLQRKP